MGVTCRLKELKCPDINICSCSRAVDESFERYDMLKLVELRAQVEEQKLVIEKQTDQYFEKEKNNVFRGVMFNFR